MVSSLFQIVIGFSGLIGLVTRFVGPLTIAPTISLIGISLFSFSGGFAGNLPTHFITNFTLYCAYLRSTRKIDF